MISQILMISQSLNDFRCISCSFTNKENKKIVRFFAVWILPLDVVSQVLSLSKKMKFYIQDFYSK